MSEQLKGTEETKKFYNREGWRIRDGQTTDSRLFWTKESGPIRQELRELHRQRVRLALSRAGEKLNLLECGCGGSPALMLLDICSQYTGVDFSEKGLELAKSKLESKSIPYQLKLADVCQLPFEKEQFDAVYSAHMLYHIENPLAQKAALNEMFRVIKPGGVVVLIVANPRPLLFPIRLVIRLVADTPVIGSIANRLRFKPVLPYNPRPLGWMRRQLNCYGSLEIVTHSLPSTYFNQHISEHNSIGKNLWRILRWLDIKFPKLSAYLGSYVQITVTKH